MSWSPRTAPWSPRTAPWSLTAVAYAPGERVLVAQRWLAVGPLEALLTAGGARAARVQALLGPLERALLAPRRSAVEGIAARLAAKRALAALIATVSDQDGPSASPRQLFPRLQLVRNPLGQPVLQTDAALTAWLSRRFDGELRLSLTHDRQRAGALVAARLSGDGVVGRCRCPQPRDRHDSDNFPGIPMNCVGS